jgi:hypothetical protein
MMQALDAALLHYEAALLHYDADNRKSNAREQKPLGTCSMSTNN